MRHATSLAIATAACALLASAFAVAAPADGPDQAAATASSVERGAALFPKMCGECHPAAQVVATRRTSAEWQDVLNDMITEGATGSEKDFENVFAYLVLNYGRVLINRATSEDISMTLGVSKQDADAIVLYRTSNGPFKDLAALTKVPGIEVAKIEARKDALVF